MFIFQSLCLPDPHAAIWELILIADAAKKGGADCVTAVIPYPAYARQDRDEPRGTSIAFRLLCDILETAGVDRFITGNLHAAQETGFSRKPWDIVRASEVLAPEIVKIVKLDHKNTVVVAPDLGAVKSAKAWMNLLRADSYAAVDKRRNPNTLKTTSTTLTGDVNGRSVVIYDDETASAKTLVDAANLCLAQGARAGGIYAAVAHSKLTKLALKLIQDSPIDRLYITDSIPPKGNHPKLQVVSYAPALARQILQIHREDLN